VPGCPPEDHLARFLSGQLDAVEEESLCGHVENCSRCQSVLETLTRKLYAPEEIRTIQGFDPPPNEDFLQRLNEDFLQRLKEASPSGPWRPGALDAPAPTGSATRDTPWNPEQKEALPPPGEPLQVPGYEILGELGRGGMGIVYQARHLRLNRIVALKMVRAVPHLRDRDLVRFKAEAEALARMQHPNVVQVYEVGEHDGHPFLALEFVAGGSLDKKLGGKPLPVREAAALVQILARAVQKVHEQGTLHRDLKPANVLLAADGTPKITDFGLAKRLDEDAGVAATGMVLGTPSYVAPEQAQGQKETIGPAIDVYALGAVLYELLTGRPPFLADTALHTVYQVIHQEPVPPRRLEPHVRAIWIPSV
jgi:serine/threonine protein kinase